MPSNSASYQEYNVFYVPEVTKWEIDLFINKGLKAVRYVLRDLLVD